MPSTLARFAGLAILLSSACSSPEQVPPRSELASADHHLHIRSVAGAEHFDRLSDAIGERDSLAAPSAPIQAPEAIAALDAAGLEGGVVISNAYMYGMPELPLEDEAAKVRAENEYVANQVAHYSDRLVALCSLNPLRPYAMEEIRACGADSRIGGVKLHFTNSDVDLRDSNHVEQLGDLFWLLDQLELPVLVHMRTRADDYGAQDAESFIDRVLSQAPSIPIQIAHMAGWGGYDDATDQALSAFVSRMQNGRLDPSRITFSLGAVVFDPAAAGADTTLARRVRDANVQLAERIREIGVEHVVYATDWPSWPPVADPQTGIAANMRLIRSALPLTEPELTQIFTNVGPILRAGAARSSTTEVS